MERMEKLAIGVDEMGERLGISRSTAYEMTRKEGFPIVRVGKRILIPVEGLRKWLETQAKI